jgi:hypothetical protein
MLAAVKEAVRRDGGATRGATMAIRGPAAPQREQGRAKLDASVADLVA